MAKKKATTRETRAVKQPVVDLEAEAKAKRSEVARKAAITRKANADRRAAEARKAEEARKAKEAEAKRQADAKAEADRKVAEAKRQADAKAEADLKAAQEARNEELRRQKAAEAKRAEEARKAAAAKAEADRKAAEDKKKPFPWWWIVIPLLVVGLLAAIFWPRGNAPIARAPATDYQGTDKCVDGKIVGNEYADLSRVPVGTIEGAVIAEVSWTGTGFGGFDRAIVIVPRLDSQHMSFVRSPRTIHVVQYCGTLSAIEAWSSTHVDALLQSSQDDNGNRPDPEEIGIYLLNLDGSLTVVREAPMGPSLEVITQRVVMTVAP